MRDPHVEKLIYRLKTDEYTSFSNPPPIEEERDSFSFRLEGDHLVIEMKDHFPTAKDAQLLVEPFLRSWEIYAALHYNQLQIRFVYENAEVIDRNPPPPGSPIELQGQITAHSFLSGNITLRVNKKHYPSPPKTFIASKDVEILWQRYWGYRQNREPLLSMAYYCLTYIEKLFGNRQKASNHLVMSKKILNKLGNLTSHRGDFHSARKIHEQSDVSPLTNQEVAWIDALIKVMIHRLGEINTVPTLPQITMKDLPSL